MLFMLIVERLCGCNCNIFWRIVLSANNVIATEFDGTIRILKCEKLAEISKGIAFCECIYCMTGWPGFTNNISTSRDAWRAIMEVHQTLCNDWRYIRIYFGWDRACWCAAATTDGMIVGIVHIEVILALLWHCDRNRLNFPHAMRGFFPLHEFAQWTYFVLQMI